MLLESFDFRDGTTAGQFYKEIKARKENIPNYNRRIIPNDVKILAQAHNRSIQAIISKDAHSYKEYVKPLTDLNLLKLQFIDLQNPLNSLLGQLFV